MKKYWCFLSEVAEVGLGFKSLQNQFFYLDKNQVANHKIEEEYLLEIFRMKDTKRDVFFQTTKPTTYLFTCSNILEDIRGTNAFKYIKRMADQPATEKKQSGSPVTIKQALEAQGPGKWYAPKATPHSANIWIRKAFDSIYSPFFFNHKVTFDQRCNFIIPKTPTKWKLLAAILSSTLFSLSLESSGGSSLGAGALEITTKKLRDIKIIDFRNFDKKRA